MGNQEKKVALVTGGNRGLGLEACRQLVLRGYFVILSARDEKMGQLESQKLKDAGGDVQFCYLDVTNLESIKKAFQFVMENYGRLDVLINNAAVCLDYGLAPDEVEEGTLETTLKINVEGPFYLAQHFVPIMVQQGYGRIVNVSSGAAQLSGSPRTWAPSYCISKTALNAVTKHFSIAYQDKGILVNSVSPGWVRTEMGGPSAPLSLEEGVDTIIWAATLPENGPSGGFFRNREPIPW